jgi:hypothetical protein
MDAVLFDDGAVEEWGMECGFDPAGGDHGWQDSRSSTSVRLPKRSLENCADDASSVVGGH